MRSKMPVTAWMTCVTSASVPRLSNSRMSAPAMKLFSLPDMKITPRMRLSRAPSSTAVTMASSSSTGSRPSVFCDWPWTSMVAQAIPSRSIWNRQFFRFAISAAMTAPLKPLNPEPPSRGASAPWRSLQRHPGSRFTAIRDRKIHRPASLTVPDNARGISGMTSVSFRRVRLHGVAAAARAGPQARRARYRPARNAA